MQSGHEDRVVRQRDPLVAQPGARFRIIQQLREQTCRHLARVAAAGAAVIGAFMRIVGDMRAVAEQQHQRRMARGEAHGVQDCRRGRGLGFGGEPALDARRMLRRACAEAEAE